MHVTVVSPEQAVFDGAADAVVAPAYDGQVGILPRHAPFLTLLGTGVLQVRQGSASRRFRVAGRSEEHTSELQSHSDVVCRLLLEKKDDRVTQVYDELLSPAEALVGSGGLSPR